MKQILVNVLLLKECGLTNNDVLTPKSIYLVDKILKRVIGSGIELKIPEIFIDVDDDFDESCLPEFLTGYLGSTISDLGELSSSDSSVTQSERVDLIKRAKELEQMKSDGISEVLRTQNTHSQKIMVIEDIGVAYQKHQFYSKSPLAGVSITKKELGLNNRKLAISHLSEVELKKLKQFLDNKNRTHDPISLRVEATFNGFGQITALKFLSYD